MTAPGAGTKNGEKSILSLSLFKKMKNKEQMRSTLANQRLSVEVPGDRALSKATTGGALSLLRLREQHLL